MMNVWPTVEVLKALNKGDRLSPEMKAEYRSASRSSEPSVKIDHLVQAFELAVEDDPLLADARKGFSEGAPSTHNAMTSKAGMTVYEVRDRESPAWRGAVVCPDSDADAWLIYVNRHDHFHSSGPSVIANKKSDGSLGPSKLDRRIREQCATRSEDRRAEKEVLRSLVDALQAIAEGSEKAQVAMPTDHDYEDAVVSLSVHPIVDEEADVLEAHEKLSSIRLVFRVSSMTHKVRNDLIRICSSFVQPDESLIESVYRQDLVVEIIVTQARLIYLLGMGEETFVDHRMSPPEPKALHYASKNGLTEAYVEGHAVQAVCGQWWIPTGNEQTHAHLPVCPECEAEEPFAQALVSLARRSKGPGGLSTTDF